MTTTSPATAAPMAAPAALRQALWSPWQALAVHWFAQLPSTNAWFQSHPITEPALVVAGEQTAGQGQRGRAWHSPVGGLYWSVGYPVKQTPAPILSLAIAAALCSELRALGYGAVSVKWPNDLVANGAKLGGILVETLANGRNQWVVVVGVGINHSTPVAAEQPADRPMIGLTELPVAKPPPAAIDHDALIGQLASAALETLAQPAASLGQALHARWPALDALAGRAITLAQPSGGVVSGTAQGIAMDGGLRVLTATGEQTFYSGESRVMSGWQASQRPLP